MNSIAKSLLALSAIFGFVVASPVEFKSIDTEIVPAAEGDVNYRLSRNVEVLKYVLTLTPHFQNETTPVAKTEFTFDGEVSITIKPKDALVSNITLHINDLDEVSYTLTKDVTIQTGTLKAEEYDAKTDKWTITLDNNLSMAEHVLKINYVGHMRDDMQGFYRSYYKENGKKVWMASTQLQQTEARRAFPCFDEPGIKSTFKLTLRIPYGMNALSNTNGVSRNDTVIGKTIVEFLETPKMSTYLLAFIVSKYEGLTNANTTHPFGVYARPEAKAQTKMALDFGQDMLNKLGAYVGIDYYSVEGVTKMEMAAIPDFSAGAMENWGLLTYRETGVLYYENDTPSINEQRIIAVIAHEQAHMWFGDLVTCDWWSETWLNEGFARYFQYFGVKMIKTDWDLEEQFVVENLQQSMQLDSTDNTHPMTDLTVSTKAQASAMFDNISYNKAASIIRMLSHYIGMTKFQQTLNKHLDSKRFEAVVPDDLFTAITIVNPGEDGYVARWFAPWTQTAGFPLVTVELNNQTIKLTQKRFMRMEANNSKIERYNIPITYAIDSDNYEDTTPKFVFRIEDGVSKTFDLTKKPQKYIILNPKQTGYYRVNYDVDNWMKIKDGLFKENHDGIHVMNRAQIVDDLFNLARAGIVKYDTAVDIIRYIKKEKNYIPWLSAISHGLTFLSQRVNGEKNAEVFSWFIKDTMDEIYKHLKFAPQANDRRTDIYNRVNVVTWACKYGHEDCVKDAKESFANFMKTPATKIAKDQRSYVYCNGVRYGGKAEFDFLYGRFLTEDIAAEQLNLLIGMGCTKDVDSAKKYLNLIIVENDVRPQDSSGAINNLLSSNPEGITFIYDYIVADINRWRTKIGGLGMLSTVAGRFTTMEQFKKYEDFLNGKKTDLGTSYEGLYTSLVTSRKNLEWDETYMKEFMAHLTKLKNSAPAKTISILASLISLAVLFLFN